MLIGYARVSTRDQTLSLQQDALQRSGCERTFTDTASGARADRPGLEEAVDFARSGDTLVVWRLERGRRGSRPKAVAPGDAKKVEPPRVAWRPWDHEGDRQHFRRRSGNRN